VAFNELSTVHPKGVYAACDEVFGGFFLYSIVVTVPESKEYLGE
jgi:hypothetical protein